MIVEAQLGRRPRGDWRVSRRCGCGSPQVIETEPLLEDGTPFPTLWWLTCRSLVTAVSRLESEGFMAGLNDRLTTDKQMAALLDASLRRYIEARNSLGVIDSPKHPGGWPGKIKCLHAHVAAELMGVDDPVGQAALDEIGWADPKEPCV